MNEGMAQAGVPGPWAVFAGSGADVRGLSSCSMPSDGNGSWGKKAQPGPRQSDARQIRRNSIVNAEAKEYTHWGGTPGKKMTNAKTADWKPQGGAVGAGH